MVACKYAENNNNSTRTPKSDNTYPSRYLTPSPLGHINTSHNQLCYTVGWVARTYRQQSHVGAAPTSLYHTNPVLLKSRKPPQSYRSVTNAL